MPDTTREERLAELPGSAAGRCRCSTPTWLDIALTAMDGLKQEDWAALTRKAPDRIIQGLAMTAKMAGYGDKMEHEVRGHLDLYERINAMPDSELEALREQRHREEAPAMLTRIANALPPTLARQLRALPEDAKERVYAAMAAPEWRCSRRPKCTGYRAS